MTTTVDFDWANSRFELSIHELVALSLGYELNTVAPVDFIPNGQHKEPPPSYRERVVTTFEAAQAGALKTTGRTGVKGQVFNVSDDFHNGQFWYVAPAEFRRFCDAEGWEVPAGWLPRGYEKPAPGADKPLSQRERTTYLNTIAVLVELMQSPKSDRDSEAAIIREMLNNYDDRPGISKRKLEDVFRDAKRSLNSS